MPITQPDPFAEKVWTIHCDGAWCHAGAGAAAVITSPAGVKHRYAACLSFALESDRCTNNIAEYEAVILGLRKLRALEVTTCIIKTDSKVVAGQVEKDYAARLSFAMESDRCTNNIAEYEAVILGLRKLRTLGVKIGRAHV